MPRVSSHWPVADPRLGGISFQLVAVSTALPDSNQTYSTAVLLGGMIDRTITAARTDTLPTAAQLVEACQGVMVGHSFDFYVRNKAGGAFLLTVAVGAGGTLDTGSTNTVSQSNCRTFRIVFTNVTLGSEAYVLHSLGQCTT